MPGRGVFGEGSRPRAGVYGFSIFLGAFLLFLLQPMVAKRILPWFGGGASVWGACLVFFQGTLLGGYALAHKFGQDTRTFWRLFHLILLFGALLLLPILPSVYWKPESDAKPMLAILSLLFGTIGLPYLVLTITSPLVQSWLTEDYPKLNVYRFYSLSNLGSMLALVSYPVAIEPFLTLRAQSWLWSALFTLYAGALGWIGIVRFRARFLGAAREPSPVELTGSDSTSISGRLAWILLGALPSALLVSLTTQLTTNIAPIPFLWILPLGLYLLSFILCFDHPRWYRRGPMLALFPVAIAFLVLLVSDQHRLSTPAKAIPLAILSFFVFAMVCHGELVLRKPSPRRITGFYLHVSLGGFLGGVFSGLLAPSLFRSPIEILLILVFGIIFVPFLVFRGWEELRESPLRRMYLAASSGFALVFGGVVYYQHLQALQQSVAVTRNFYGALRVMEEGEDDDRVRTLIDGHIRHGSQFLSEARRGAPTTYFGPGSGVQRVFQALNNQPRKVAILGLGAGTLARYGQAADEFHFFELNPDVIAIAQRDFTYLRDSPSRFKLISGDGRLSLERLPVQGYDLIILDAFTSDAIPIHLLTREAFQLYSSHLKQDGVIAINITNRYLDLDAVLGNLAKALRMDGVLITNGGNLGQGLFGSKWVVLAGRGGGRPNPVLDEVRAHGGALPSLEDKATWTDDHSNLLGIVRWRQ